MEIFIYFISVFGGIVGLILLVEKPYLLVGFVIFLNIYNLNIEIPGPLNLRGLFTLILFVRIIVFDKDNLNLVLNVLSKNISFLLILAFGIVSFIVTYNYFPILKPPLKTLALNIMILLLGFIVLFKGKEKESFFLGFVLAGLFATIDLVYSRWIMGSLSVYKIINIYISGKLVADNHNVYGTYNGFAILYSIYYLKYEKLNKYFLLTLLAIFTFGIIISTSRSSIVGVVIILVIMNYFEKFKFFKPKNLIFGSIFLIGTVLMLMLGFSLLASSTSSSSKLVTKMSKRLSEIPQMLMGDKIVHFDPQSGMMRTDNFTWRIEKWTRDLQKYTERDLSEQIFGTGVGSYKKSFGKARFMPHSGDRQVFTAHNGYINILVERGLISLLLYLISISILIVTLYKLNNKLRENAGLLYVLFALLLLGHSYLVDDMGFLILGGVIGAIYLTESEIDYENSDEKNNIDNV